jgi:hypothetical protein
MKGTTMAIRIGHAVTTALGIIFLTGAAVAAQDNGAAETKAAAYLQVHAACKTDTARFCPALGQATAIPREQVMCLKTYRVDLTRECRTALAAVKSATEAEQ